MHFPAPSSPSPLHPLSPSSPISVNHTSLPKTHRPKSFSILYFNSRSLLPKLNELHLIAQAYSPSIICISETWLCPDITNCELSVQGYQLVRLDRNRSGGGVLMYISVDFNFYMLPGSEELEILSVVVEKELCKACISLFYRPPSSSSFIFDTLCVYLESLSVPQYSNFISLGDFNVNFCNHSNRPLFSKLESLSHTFAFQQIVSEPTHVHHNGCTSLIDLVFVYNPILINSCEVIPPLCNSDHNGIFIECSWRSSSRHNCENYSKGRIVWNYSQADWERASLLIESFDWSSLLSEDINEAWCSWCKQFMVIMEKCIPKKKLPKRKNLPWLNKRLVNSIKKRNLLFKQGKHSGNLSKYKLKRNKIALELRQAKQAYFRKLNPRKPKEFWQAMKHLRKQQSSIPTLTDDDGTVAHTSTEKAEMLNTFFAKCFNSESTPLEENAAARNAPQIQKISIVQKKYLSYSATWIPRNLTGQMVSQQEC